MEFIQPLFEILKCIWKPIGRRVDYGKNLPKNLTELNKITKDLCHTRDDISDMIKRVEFEKAPTRECKDWLEDVNKIETEVTAIENEHHDDKRCFKGWLPNFNARVKLGERVVETIASVKELQEKSKLKDSFVTDLPLRIVERVPIPAMIATTAADRTFQKIVNCIEDKGKQKIGIWGMGGIGKTTLMQRLNNMPGIENMFRFVIWVTVSKSSDISTIQDAIAERLSLEIENKSTHKRLSDDEVSRRLFLKLNGDKYLLLLDDVWESVDLSKVGIPCTNEDNGSKVVLTTRELRVCRGMETDEEIKVETLLDEEAWKIFESKVGDACSFPSIKPIAQEIVKECGGLPLALNVVGGSLRKVEDGDVWRNMLNKLKAPDMANVNNAYERLFDSLMVSYDQLKSDNMKKCFLYCGLYPEDHKISKSRLIKYWRAEKLLSSSEGTLAKARVEGGALLHDLTDASLLQKCKDEKHVMMHDLLRDLVLKMTSPEGKESCRQVVRAGASREHEIVKEKEWEDATRISFMFNELYVLPEKPNCPKLLTLLLQSRRSQLKAIPESFFNCMPSLCVLDLSDTAIISLPPSLSNLVNLRALFLNGCYQLKALPGEVSALKRLELLSLKRNDMVYIPSVVWELTSLRCLKFSCRAAGVSNDAMNPNGMLSNLCLLEEVNIVGDHIKRGMERSWTCLQNEASSLTRLSSFGFRFGRAGDLKHFVLNSKAWRDGNIKKFRLFVGEIPYSWSGEYKPYKSFLFCGDECGGSSSSSSSFLSALLTDVLKLSEVIALEYQELPRNLSDFGVENMHGLRYCRLYKCGALENIVDEGGIRVNAFSNLECLIFENLKNLRSICGRSPTQFRRISSSCSFISLQRLEITRCSELKTLFTWETIPVNLELLKIDHCNKFEEIMISADDINEGSNKPEYVKLQKLKHLKLEHLPEFVGFSSKGNFSLRCPELQEVSFIECPKLPTVLPFGCECAPNLREIRANQYWWDALKWDDDAVKSQFSQIFSPVPREYWEVCTPLLRYGSHGWTR